MALGSGRVTARMVRHAQGIGPCQQGTRTMTREDLRQKHRARNQLESMEAFLMKKAEFDEFLAELQQASADHFGADPEAVLWAEAAWLNDATAKLKQIADQHFRRGEFAA